MPALLPTGGAVIRGDGYHRLKQAYLQKGLLPLWRDALEAKDPDRLLELIGAGLDTLSKQQQASLAFFHFEKTSEKWCREVFDEAQRLYVEHRAEQSAGRLIYRPPRLAVDLRRSAYRRFVWSYA